jgi:hypothetical protein
VTAEASGPAAEPSVAPSSVRTVVTLPTERSPIAFAVLVVAFFAVVGSWSMSTPLFQSSDETSHVFRAVSAVRGEILVPTHGPAKQGADHVSVPLRIEREAHGALCFIYKPDVPASCARKVPPVAGSTEVGTGAARYNPIYYWLVGLPTLINTGPIGLYGMRLVSTLLSSLLLAWAMLGALQSGRSAVGVGLLLAITPEAAFLAGMINPNGVEIAAAACVWTNLLLWIQGGRFSAVGFTRFVVGACALTMPRSIDPFWLLCIGITGLCLVRWRWLRREIQCRRTLIGLGVVFVFTLLSVAWVAVSHALQLTFPQSVKPTLAGTSFNVRYINTAKRVHRWQEQLVGVFGWLDTDLPHADYTLYYRALILLALCALICRSVRVFLVLTLVAVAAVVLSRGLEAQQLGVIGRWWQGRYSLPIEMGIPILAGFGVRDVDRRWTFAPVTVGLAACVVVGWLQFEGMRRFLWRNGVGLSHPFSLSGSWSPPLGALFWLVMLLFGCAVLTSLATAALLDFSTIGDLGPADGEPAVRRPSHPLRHAVRTVTAAVRRHRTGVSL